MLAGGGAERGGSIMGGTARLTLDASELSEACSQYSASVDSQDCSGLAAAILGELDVCAFEQGGTGVQGVEEARGTETVQAKVMPGANAAAVEAYLRKKAQQRSAVRMVA